MFSDTFDVPSGGANVRRKRIMKQNIRQNKILLVLLRLITREKSCGMPQYVRFSLCVCVWACEVGSLGQQTNVDPCC